MRTPVLPLMRAHDADVPRDLMVVVEPVGGVDGGLSAARRVEGNGQPRRDVIAVLRPAVLQAASTHIRNVDRHRRPELFLVAKARLDRQPLAGLPLVLQEDREILVVVRTVRIAVALDVGGREPPLERLHGRDRLGEPERGSGGQGREDVAPAEMQRQREQLIADVVELGARLDEWPPARKDSVSVSW